MWKSEGVVEQNKKQQVCAMIQVSEKYLGNICTKGKVQKNIKKLTNVSLYVCMSAENSKILVFFMFFPQQ